MLMVLNSEKDPKAFQEIGKVKQEIVLKQLKRLNLPLDNLTFLEELKL